MHQAHMHRSHTRGKLKSECDCCSQSGRRKCRTLQHSRSRAAWVIRKSSSQPNHKVSEPPSILAVMPQPFDQTWAFRHARMPR